MGTRPTAKRNSIIDEKREFPNQISSEQVMVESHAPETTILKTPTTSFAENLSLTAKETGPSTSTFYPMKLLYANIQGLYSRKSQYKVKFLENLLNDAGASVLCLTETHLHHCITGCENCVLNSEIKISGYNLVRADRDQRKGGGCAIYISNECAEKSRKSFSTGAVEMVILELVQNNLMIITIYRPPRASAADFNQTMAQLREKISFRGTPMPNIIICGDFNFPFIDWEETEGNIIMKGFRGSIYKEERTQAQVLKEFMNEHSVSQILKQETRGSNMIDLILTNNRDLFIEAQATQSVVTDHCIIECHLNLNHKLKQTTKEQEENCFNDRNFNSRYIDWNSVNREIQTIDWQELMADKSTQEKIDLLEKRLKPIIQTHIPQRRKRRKTVIERKIRTLYRKRRQQIKHIENNTSASRKSKLIADLKTTEETLKDIYIYRWQILKKKKRPITYPRILSFFTHLQRGK